MQEGARNIKSMQLLSAVIVFYDLFLQDRGEGPLDPLPGSATGLCIGMVFERLKIYVVSYRPLVKLWGSTVFSSVCLFTSVGKRAVGFQ